MIARSSDDGANQGGESDANMLVECCDTNESGDEECETWDHMTFPTRSCDFLGIAFGMYLISCRPFHFNVDFALTFASTYQ